MREIANRVVIQKVYVATEFLGETNKG